MKPWKEIAASLGVPLAAPERVTPALDALEQSFRPLVAEIPHDAEPAPSFHPIERGHA